MQNKINFLAYRRSPGFILIEALVATVIIGFGILALARLESMLIASGGDSKNYSEAMALSRSKLASFQNTLTAAQFTALGSGTQTVTGYSGATYTLVWTITTQSDGSAKAAIKTSWTDRLGKTQRVDINSRIAKVDSSNIGISATGSGLSSATAISPKGLAIRREAGYKGNGVSINSTGGTSKLLNSDGTVILEITALNTNQTPKKFIEFRGKVYFDQTISGSAVPSSSNVWVALSSEGQCIFDNTPTNLISVNGVVTGTTNTAQYKYYGYTCYVGPEWYGNIGLLIDDSGNGPSLCLGDPDATDDLTTTSIKATPGGTRSFKGFYTTGSGNSLQYWSTGVQSGTYYGTDKVSSSSGSTGTNEVNNKAGSPRPGGMSTYSPSNFYNLDFLITKVTNGSECKYHMKNGGTNLFSNNSAAYLCINPSATSGTYTDICPTTWPGMTEKTAASTYPCTFTFGGHRVTSNGKFTTMTPSLYTNASGTEAPCAYKGGDTFECTFYLTAATNLTVIETGTEKIGNVTTPYTAVPNRTAYPSGVVPLACDGSNSITTTFEK